MEFSGILGPMNASGASSFSPVPSASSMPTFRSTTPLTPLVCDERAIARLLGLLLNKGGLTVEEASRRLGVTPNAVRQYLKGRRNKPSLIWFIRLVELCGGKVTLELPGGPK